MRAPVRVETIMDGGKGMPRGALRDVREYGKIRNTRTALRAMTAKLADGNFAMSRSADQDLSAPGARLRPSSSATFVKPPTSRSMSPSARTNTPSGHRFG